MTKVWSMVIASAALLLLIPATARAAVPGSELTRTVVPNVLGRCVAQGPDGLVYFAGTSDVSWCGVRGLDASSGLRWALDHEEIDGGFTTAMRVDGAGNAFSLLELSDGRYYVAKYGPQGTTVWLRAITGTVHDIVVDGAGNCYAVGDRRYSKTGWDVQIYKLSPAGAVLWSRHYHRGKGKQSDYGLSATFAPSGSLVVSGMTNSGGSRGMDVLVVKYSASGTFRWARAFARPRVSRRQDSWDTSYRVATDGKGDIVAFGWSRLTDTNWDFLVVKYSAGGKLRWSRSYSAPVKNQRDISELGGVDAAGNVYVVGESYSTNKADYAIVSYSPGGKKRWTRRYDGPAHLDDEPLGMVVDRSAGLIYVTGKSAVTETYDSDIATVCYNAAGVRQWSARSRGGAFQDYGWGIALGSGGDLLVGGATGTGDGPTWNGVLLRYQR